MTVLLNRAYGAYAAGQIVSLPASTEAAIIAQNLGQATAAAVTAGNIISNEAAGRAAFPSGFISVVITNPNVNPSSKVTAVLAQTGADTALTSIARVVAGNGQFTVYGNAGANAITQFDWAIVGTGMTPNQ